MCKNKINCDGCDNAFPVEHLTICGNSDDGEFAFCASCIAPRHVSPADHAPAKIVLTADRNCPDCGGSGHVNESHGGGLRERLECPCTRDNLLDEERDPRTWELINAGWYEVRAADRRQHDIPAFMTGHPVEMD